MEVPFQGSNLKCNQTAFKKSMSKVRIKLEWVFKEVKMYFPVVDTKQKLKISDSLVGLLYIATMVVCNIRNCIYPNQISRFFGVPPPSIPECISSRGAEVPEE